MDINDFRDVFKVYFAEILPLLLQRQTCNYAYSRSDAPLEFCGCNLCLQLKGDELK